ncbi:MAG: hypothetical protein AB1489_12085 [Acidobacteriota bacterium]
MSNKKHKTWAADIDANQRSASFGIKSDGNPVEIACADDGSVKTASSPGTLTDRSGTTSGTANNSTPVAAANTLRRYFLFQNISDTTQYINFGGAATVDNNSIKVGVNEKFVMEGNFISTEAVNVICTAASNKFVAKEG